MNKINLGKTGFAISPVVYAGITSMSEPQADSDRYVAAAVDAGVNYFDVAPSYGNAESVLGASLEPFRGQVHLACKTMRRDAKGAEEEFRSSLINLRTDWFDVYQLHALSTPQDVAQAFAPGGVMELLLRLKQEGAIRAIGFSAHSERAALEALKLYDFDTVMFPMNWLLHMGQGIGGALGEARKARGFGLLGIKSIVERAFLNEDERAGSAFPKSWCKPFDANEVEARLAAMRYSYSLGADALIPPGNWECQSFMMAHAGKAKGQPLSSRDTGILAARFAAVKEHPFFSSDEGGWDRQ